MTRRHRPYPLFAGALFVTMLVSTIAEFVIGVLAPILVDELAIGEAAIGLVAAMMYLSAAAFARASGRLLDETSSSTVLTVLFGGAVGSLTLLATATSLPWLFLAALLAGIPLSVNNPITSRYIVDRLAPGQRGFTLGIKQTGVKFGQMLAGASIPWLAATFGWRPGLALFAVGMLAVLPLTLLILPNVAPTRPTRVEPARESIASARVQVGWLRRYAVAMAVGQSATTTYLVLYGVRALGFDLVQAGFTVTVFGLAAALGRLSWVVAAERFVRVSTPLMMISALAMLAIGAVVAAPGLGLAALWTGAALAGASVGSWYVVVQLAILAEVEPSRTGSATGAVQSAFMFGMAIGAPIFGLIVEVTGSFAAAWSVGIVLSGTALMTAWSRDRSLRAMPPVVRDEVAARTGDEEDR